MNKLICVVGPTASGKTAKALALASQSESIIVSADSRQVYRGMDIVTGKDHPKDVEIYGIDLVDPAEDCSVAIWHDSVLPIMNSAWGSGKQVILVGGTGLYIKAIISGIATMDVPVNQALRDQLGTWSVASLQQELSVLDLPKYQAMNHSDVNNPRRLVRAIEVAKACHIQKVSHTQNLDLEMIGLFCSNDLTQRNRIMQRVNERLALGAIKETEELLAKYDASLKSLSALGYRSIIKYLNGAITKDEMISSWVADELAYVKRQMTWFRKVESIKWYDVA